MDDFSAWIGRTETASDVVSASQLAGLAALLDHDAPPWRAGEAPPLGHWLHFLPHARQSDIGEDGHPKRGGFLPPVPLPRRMWAGGRLELIRPIPIGAAIHRRSTIADIRHKRGASGDLVFVTLRHEIEAGGETAVIEEQDLVYRDDAHRAAPASGNAPPPPAASHAAAPVAEIARTIVPDPVQLFRFSALTFNAHRIHYDREYASGVEGYTGLVVQGPFLATLLMDHFLRATPDARVARFSFRAQAPLLDTYPFDLCLARKSGAADLWTRNHEGRITMTAEVEFAASRTFIAAFGRRMIR